MSTMDERELAELVDKLAQYRTDNTDEAELINAFYGSQYEKLDTYTDVELAEMIKQEIDDD